MWFGTQDGLNRYDGYNFTVYSYKPDDPTSIGDNNINVIYEDSNGDLWFGTQINGVSLYDRDTERFTNFSGIEDDEETISYNTVRTILEDSEGMFWVGTGHGLNLMNRENGTFRRIYSETNDATTVSNNDVTVLFEDSNGTLWVGTADGLNRLNRETGEFKRYLHFDQDSNKRIGLVREIYEDRYEILWIGTEDQGVFQFDRDDETFNQFINDPDDPFSYSGISGFSILEDNRGNLWFATGNRGLNLFNREEQIFYRFNHNPDDPYSLNNDGIIKLHESRENIIWIGTFAGGINYHELTEEVFRHFQNEPQNPRSLSHNVVQALHEDENGDIWVGTYGGGLNIFNPVTENFQRFYADPNNPENPSSDVILDIHENEYGIWLATYGQGVDMYDKQQDLFFNYRHRQNDPQSLSSDFVFDIYESSDGHLWFSTNWGGVTEFNPQDETYYWYVPNPDDSEDTSALQNEAARAVYEDSFGDIWIGTYGGVVNRLDRDSRQFTIYDINEHSIFFGSAVQTIYEDSEKRLWLGTRGAGLMKFDRNQDTLVPYATTEQHLPNNIVHAIAEDDNGYLWLSTNDGLVRFSPDENESRTFNLENGLNIREFLPGSALKDRKGNLYFGGVLGFQKFHPDSIRADSTVHPVVFTDFLLFNESVPVGGDSPLQQHINRTERLILPHNSSVITLEYAALNFSHSKADRFAYKLEGFDDDWNVVDTQRRATYTNLNPGEYTFKVRSANPDGIWNEEYASVIIQITPPFWRTAWFIGLAVVFILFIIFGIYRYRVRQIRIQKIKLEQKVRERTEELRKANETKNRLFSIIGHDLRNHASSFVGFTSLLKDSAVEDNLEEMKEFIFHLDQAASQFMDFLQNLLDWARDQSDIIQFNPELIEADKIIRHTLKKAESAASKKNISIVSVILPGLKLFTDTNMLSIVIYNLLNNAIKFSPEGSKVEIKAFETDDDFVEIIVQDYGVGMDEETVRKLLTTDEYHSTRGTSGEKGTGLGLNLCKNLISKNDGSLDIESKKGEGTKVTIKIPAAKKKEMSEAS